MATATGREAVEFSDEVLAGDAALDQAAEAFAGVFVDDRDDLDGPPVGGGVELKIDRPHPVGCIRAQGVGCRRGALAFAPPPLRNTQPFLAPETLNPLMIDDPTLATGVVIRGPKPAPRMILGVLA
jgi:hypothetical protein